MKSNKISRYEIAEKIYESRCTLVYRGRRAESGEAVVLKILKPDAVTQDEAAHLKSEFNITSRISLPGVVKTYGLEEYEGRLTMVMEDIGGESLDRLVERKSFTLVQFLELATGLADTLAGIHQMRIIHKDINLAHVVVNPETGQFRLIDFGIADELPQRTIALQPPTALEGTLAYISPEQTGRMNRVVDYRTDFYSLGVLFYRMLTGKMPFEADDALGMVHCHIAGTPVAPHALDSSIPDTLSRIVMKLMAKMAEDRYQSGRGLKADLVRCSRELAEKGWIREFELGEEDFSDRLQVPQKLYGREKEAGHLLAIFERASVGISELLLVAGYAGVGKTALIHGTYNAVSEKRGHFIEGKFDQLRRNEPYFGWIQAFEGLVNYLLMESETELAQWKNDISCAARSNGRVLTDVIPKLELIIGPQSAVTELSGAEAQNRFTYVFLEFVKTIATIEHPLIVFLDDLQWIDAASLGLLKALLTSNIPGILVVGAYRDNEVDALHPLMLGIDALRKEQTNVELMTLGNLSEDTVNELISDTLRCEPSQTVPLTRLIHSKTGGNAFFTLQTLSSLAEKQTLLFDAKSRRWQWDISALTNMEITDNVVTLMLGKIHKLAPEAQRILPLCACMGFRFSLSSLSIIAEQSEEISREDLWPALSEGLIIPLNSGYQFVHDRVQQAAYSMIPDADKKFVHLKIGRLILQQLPEHNHEEGLFAVVDHLNRGVELIETLEEKLVLARLNLQAGGKAKASAAYSVAIHYLNQGIRLLPPNSWQSSYDLTLAFYKESAECEYCVGRHQIADSLITAALEHAASVFDKASIYSTQIEIFTTQNRFADAISAGLHSLRLFGVELPDLSDEAVLHDALTRELAEYKENIARVNIPSLVDAPKMSDPSVIACVNTLVHMTLVAQYFNSNLMALLTARIVNLSLRFGNAKDSPLGYILMSLVSVVFLSDYRSARELGQLVLQLVERHKDAAFKGRILMSYAHGVAPWFYHLKEGIPVFRKAFQISVESGGLSEAMNSLWGIFKNMLLASSPLDDTFSECINALDFAKKIHDKGFQVAVQLLSHIVLCFQGHLDAAAPWVTRDFNEAECLAQLDALNWQSALFHYNVFKTWTLFAFGHYDKALQLVDASQKTIRYGIGNPNQALHYFHQSLILSLLYTDASQEARRGFLKTIRENQEKLLLWSENCPENFLHQYLLVEAEIARIENRKAEAIKLYDKAIASAAQNEVHYVEATACELAAKFWLSEDKEDFARLYVIRAHQAYVSWQAWGKVKALEAEYPQWLLPASGTEGSQAPETSLLDLNTVMKSTRVIASEIELTRLLGALMRIVIENVGAQNGFLLLEKDGTWEITAKGEIGAAEVEMPAPVGMDESSIVSLGVVRFVTRTKELVVLEDAANQGQFTNDPHIEQNKTKSLLCAPLLSRGRLVGVLYLENNLITHAFTPERVELMEMLLSQAAISLENARIYESLRESETMYRSLVTSMAEGVVFQAADGRITAVNPEAERIVGRTAEQMIAQASDRSLWTAVHEDGTPFPGELSPSRITLLTGEPQNDVVMGIHRPDGTLVWISVNSQPLIFPGETKPYAVVTTFHDITERKQSEESLRRVNRELRAISNCNQTLMRAEDELTLVKDICRIVCNEAGYRMAWVGYAERDDAHTVRPVVWAGVEDGYLASALITWDDTERGCGPVGTAIRNGKSVYIPDFTIDPTVTPWRDGALRRGYRSCIAFPLKDESENTFGALNIYSAEPNAFTPAEIRLLEELAGDLAFGITVLRTRAERQRAEESMKQAKEAAESANKAKDQFLAVLSHELRTPLTPVLATVSARQAQKDLPEEQRAEMELIRRNVEMEAKLIDDLLDLTKISRGKLELHPEIVDTHLLLQMALDICKKEIRSKRLDISLSLRANPHHTRADPTRLRQVFWNLLKNAVEFTPEEGRIGLRTSNANGGIKIEIEDTGVGIRPELLPKIFNAFERGDRESATTRFGGLGLGLSIAKAVVDMHQGALTAFSEGEGKGATFTVELPLIAPVSEQPPRAELVASLPPEEQPRKILLIDDHPDTLATMSKLLRKWGYTVVTGDCVQAALELAAREPFDLLLSDLGLPDGSGLDIIRKVKPLYALRGIALSGYGTEEDIRRSREAGFDEHLTKPVNFQTLRQTIHRVASKAA